MCITLGKVYAWQERVDMEKALNSETETQEEVDLILERLEEAKKR